MRINRYFPFAVVYFFLNSVGLPFGLTYTALLSPLLYWWVVTQRKKEILLPFFICLLPFVIAHLIEGVEMKAYLISIINYTAVYIFCHAFFNFLVLCEDVEKIFRNLLIINFILCLIAIPLYFTSFDQLFWTEQSITDGVGNFKRLKIFTYEASHYATLFTPLFFFYLLQVMLKQNKTNSWLLLCMILLPYILSFSIGVIGSITFSLIFTCLLYFKNLMRKRRVLNLLTISAAVAITAIIILVLFFPTNTFFLRLENIFLGVDTSGQGRTFEAFYLAKQVLAQKSELWGIGIGQIKILGADIIRSYYLYGLDYNKIAIPNAAAETLAIFGWIGLVLRISIQLFLFFYTRVWSNYYRLILFLFVFLYQFTGSFITNLAEYVLWILAFTNSFPQYDVKTVQQQNLQR